MLLLCKILQMEVTDELVDKIATLARLKFEGQEKEDIKKDMSRILGFIDALNSVDTEGVDPLIYMTEETLRLRNDVSEVTINHEEALKNAPNKDSDFIRVPKVLSKKQ